MEDGWDGGGGGGQGEGLEVHSHKIILSLVPNQ